MIDHYLANLEEAFFVATHHLRNVDVAEEEFLSQRDLLNLQSTCRFLRSSPRLLNGITVDSQCTWSPWRLQGFLSWAQPRALSIEKLELSCPSLNSKLSCPDEIWSFTRLTNLRLEEFADIQLSSQLTNLRNLECLHIYTFRKLITLPPSISALQQLKSLSVSVCRQLKNIPPAIVQCTKLTCVALRWCPRMTDIPRMPSVQTLELRQCKRIESLPSNIGECANLKELTVSDCFNLTGLPQELSKCMHLTSLDLQLPWFSRSLPMPVFPEVVAALSKLKILNIQCRFIGRIPAVLKNMTSLEVLIAGGTSLGHGSTDTFKRVGDSDLPETLTRLDLSNQSDLETVDLHFSSLRCLILEGCKSLKDISVVGLSNLQHLCLSNCSNIKQLPSEISACSQLSFLDLSGCVSLHSLDNVDFHRLVGLRQLKLNHCSSLSRLPPQLFEAQHIVPHMTVLHLGGCTKLSALPSSISNLTNLRSLILSDSGIKSFPDEISLLSRLSVLTLDGCKYLQEVPPSIASITALEYLTLQNNKQIDFLPDSIGNLGNLQHIDARESGLVYLPSSIGKLQSLEELWLYDCESLLVLPSELGDCARLEFLGLSGCQKVHKLPRSITRLTNLTGFSLPSCKRVELIPDLSVFSRLEWLHCDSEAMLRQLGPSLASLTGLKQLVLDKMEKKQRIPRELKSLSNLTELVLTTWTSCKHLGSTIFHLTKLRHLNINYMAIEDIPPGISKLKELRRLEVAGCNCLKRLPAELTALHNLRFLQLSCGMHRLEIPPPEVRAMDAYKYAILQNLDNEAPSHLYEHFVEETGGGWEQEEEEDDFDDFEGF